jgi:hypothetical protein
MSRVEILLGLIFLKIVDIQMRNHKVIKAMMFQYCVEHSNSKKKIWVSATETFRKTTFTEVSSSKILPETSVFRIETSGFRTKTSGFWTKSSGFWPETSGFSTRNFGIFDPKLRAFDPKFRVFKPKILQRLHSNSKFRVTATEAFRKTTFTEVSSSKNLSETSVFQPKLRVFEPKLRVFEPKHRAFDPKFRVFKPKLLVLQRFFLSYRNFEYWFWEYLRPKFRNIKSIRSF